MDIPERLRDLAGRLLNAQEEERRRLAREVHDDLSQRLAGLAIMAGGMVKSLKGVIDPGATTLGSIDSAPTSFARYEE